MISCSNEVMTPGTLSVSPSFVEYCSAWRRQTERMPNDQGQFRHLFPLLTQFHQSSLSRAPAHKLGNPAENPPIFLNPIAVNSIGAHAVVCVHRVGIVIVDSDTVVMLCLGDGCSLRLCLCMMVGGWIGMLWLMKSRLLMKP